MSKPPILRIARPTNSFEPLLRFYCDGLGFVRLAQFEDHDGFDGIMLGHPGWPYHLEFTSEQGVVAHRSPSTENLLVLYLPDLAVWQDSVGRVRAAGFEPVQSHNPYWDRNGVTFEDPDGYRVVLQNAGWSS